MSHNRPEISIVIPVYRSARMIGPLMERLLAVLDGLGRPYEIVCVEDGSGDDTWAALVAAHDRAPERTTAVQLMRNFGQHNALMCGLRMAQGRYIITMDDDLQHPPEEIPKLLSAIERSGDDLVYGVPEERQHRQWRNLGSMVVTAFYRLVFRSHIQPSPFRAMRRELVEAILSYSLNYTYIDGLLAWNTQRISQVITEHKARAVGRSGYSLRKLLVLALNLFTNFSILPLQVASLVGLLAAAGGLLGSIYYLVAWLFARIEVPGYASTILSVLVLGGLQLLSLGVIGEYLGRLHLNMNRKPQYTIREVRSSGENDAVAADAGDSSRQA